MVGKAGPPPPREVAYSELLRAVNQQLGRLGAPAACMGRARWDFTVTVPMDHPLRGIPIKAAATAAAGAAARVLAFVFGCLSFRINAVLKRLELDMSIWVCGRGSLRLCRGSLRLCYVSYRLE